MARQYVHHIGDNLPSAAYLSIVGSYGYLSSAPQHYNRTTHDHAFLWIAEPNSGCIYECALHTALTFQSQIQTCLFTEPCPLTDWPQFGIDADKAFLSYQDLGLKQSDFRSVGQKALGDEINGLAVRSDRIQIYGFSHKEGNGLHDVHQNSGESPNVRRLNRPGQDGCIIFYYAERGQVLAHRLFLGMKFENQHL